MSIEIRQIGAELTDDFLGPIRTAFGFASTPDRVDRLRRIPEFDLRLAAYDGSTVVGSAGAFSFDLSTTDGHSVPTSGLTMVAVSPTHRRKGVLRKLMRHHLDAARGRGQPIAALWASEGQIYGRFGYGVASFEGDVSIERDRSAFVGESVPFQARLLGENEALETFPPIYERARRAAPGMPSRSPVWWTNRRLMDVESHRVSGGPLQRVVLTIDGRDDAYALYRLQLNPNAGHQIPVATVKVIEAIGASPRGTRAIFRYLCDIDLADRIDAVCLPVDHPLFLMLAEARRMHFETYDALWIRIIDVPSALAARRYGAEGSLVLEIADEDCPWNAGRFRFDARAATAHRTQEPADLRLDIRALGSAYLGGVSFTRLSDFGTVEAKDDEVLALADRMFATPRAPWCPEIF